MLGPEAQQEQGTPGPAPWPSPSEEVGLEGQGAHPVMGGAQEAVGAQRRCRPSLGDWAGFLQQETRTRVLWRYVGGVSQAQGGAGGRSAPGGRNYPVDLLQDSAWTPARNGGSWRLNSSGEKQ